MHRIKVLDKGYVELIDYMGNDQSIVDAARVSYDGSTKGQEADKKLLFYLWENHHTTPFEQVQLRFKIKAPIFVARQWMRHRTWSFNEISRRYTSENVEFYIPNEFREQDETNKQGSNGLLAGKSFLRNAYQSSCEDALSVYNYLIEFGVAREQARGVLPMAMYTTFIGSVNLHNLLKFVTLRMHPHAQWEIRQYARAIYWHFIQDLFPWTFEAYERERNVNL
jgi:thymidylate synthase (FAD)